MNQCKFITIMLYIILNFALSRTLCAENPTQEIMLVPNKYAVMIHLPGSLFVGQLKASLQFKATNLLVINMPISFGLAPHQLPNDATFGWIMMSGLGARIFPQKTGMDKGWYIEAALLAGVARVAYLSNEESTPYLFATIAPQIIAGYSWAFDSFCVSIGLGIKYEHEFQIDGQIDAPFKIFKPFPVPIPELGIGFMWT